MQDIDAFVKSHTAWRAGVDDHIKAILAALDARPTVTQSTVTHDHIAALNDRLKTLEGGTPPEYITAVNDAIGRLTEEVQRLTEGLDNLRTTVEAMQQQPEPAPPNPEPTPQPEQPQSEQPA